MKPSEPIVISSPDCSSTSPSILLPLTSVPLRLPRSLIVTVVPLRVIAQCWRLIEVLAGAEVALGAAADQEFFLLDGDLRADFRAFRDFENDIHGAASHLTNPV